VKRVVTIVSLVCGGAVAFVALKIIIGGEPARDTKEMVSLSFFLEAELRGEWWDTEGGCAVLARFDTGGRGHLATTAMGATPRVVGLHVLSYGLDGVIVRVLAGDREIGLMKVAVAAGGGHIDITDASPEVRSLVREVPVRLWAGAVRTERAELLRKALRGDVK